MDPGAGAAPGKRTRAFPRSRAERVASADRRARWLAVYAEVRRRHAAGETLMGIGRALGLARGTARKLARAASCPERAARAPGPSRLDPFVPHPEARVAAGCENGAALRREVRALGYPGPAKQVHRWRQDRRTAPAKTTADRWRREAPARAGGAPPLLSPKRLAWALVRPAEALDAEEAAAVARVGRDPEAVRVASLARRFTGIVRAACRAAKKKGAVAGLDAWVAEARSCGVAAVETFAAGLEQDGAAVRAALTTPWSSGQAAGQINRLKLLKRRMYGRPSLDLLRRPTLLAAWSTQTAEEPRNRGNSKGEHRATLSFYRLPRQHHKHLKSTDAMDKRFLRCRGMILVARATSWRRAAQWLQAPPGCLTQAPPA